MYKAFEANSAHETLAEIEQIIQEQTEPYNRTTKLILAGDFNCHHPA